MAATSRGCSWLRLPRPKTFLGLMSLQTGAELISLALVFNKATGVYGFLTLLTGYAPSALQVTSYTISILVIVALAYLIPHIRQQSPFQNLALAWLYVIDTISNIAYTTAFATIWYMAGFHDPAGPGGAAAGSPSTRDDGQPDSGAANPDTAASMVLAVLFTSVRIYFSLVVLAHARVVVQRYSGDAQAESVDAMIARGDAPDPFAVGSTLGEGWKGKIGRIMIGFGRGYWLGGRKEDEEWARAVGAKFRTRGR
ncbi:Inositolphosphorylceramide synthase subunit Kei1-domain-containing protein [Echria macrotheca]|uniref:Inositolphosphorylceramide synthase subunit Kei1-domain-containing protein n=1 Tax=Echria macrotheca TaxID=438768 RepID=A0AAJ0B5C6_9PEZI|nr:Inositolphosphorylceramide synthase subunit Kei1-domain-containing protein [Echria macrotheca]